MSTETLKTYFWLLLDLLLVGIIVNLVFFVMPAIQGYRNSLPATRILTVSSEGKTTVSPDLAEISFSVLSRGQNPEALAADGNRKMSAAIDYVKSQGVDAKDIKTTGYNLSPEYRYDPKTGESSITGYTLTQTVSVKIRNLDNVAKILGGLVPLGVNLIGGVNFTIEDQEKFLKEARADAFRKAQDKAESMAWAAGTRLGRVVNVYESQGGPIYYAERAVAYGGDGGVPAPTIEPGTQEVKIQVSLTYELR